MVAILASSGTVARAPDSRSTTELSYEQAIVLAADRDDGIGRAKTSLEIATLGVINAKADYLPRASVQISANQSATGSAYRTEDLSFRRGITGNFVGTLGASVAMPVDISGAIGRQVQAARIQRSLAELNQDRATRDAIIDIQIAYLTALQAQHLAEVDRSIVGSIERLTVRARTQLPTILPFLEVELATARETLSQSEASADQAKDSLKLALRLSLGLELQLISPIPSTEAAQSLSVESGNEKFADVEAAKLRVASAELAAEMAKDVQRPSLRVSAYATQTLSGRFIDEAGRTTNRDYGLNVAVNLPLLNYDAGRSDNSIKATKLMAEQARADAEIAELSAELGIRQAEQAVKRAEERMKRLPDPEAAAEALANATKSLFAAPAETGPALIAQVSNARQSWRFAQGAVTDARVGLTVAKLRLARASGVPVVLKLGQST